MALTRQERIAIDKLEKLIKKLEVKIKEQQITINSLNKIVNRMDSGDNMAEWTREQWQKFLKPYLPRGTRNTGILQHDHTNEQNGGDCFAKLGANLIE